MVLKRQLFQLLKNPVILILKEKLGFLLYISSKYVFPQDFKKQGKHFKEINESNVEDEKSCTCTKPCEETDSSNDLSYSMQKLFRTKTKEEPKKLDKTLLKSMQDVKSEIQTFLSEFASGNVKEERHSSKVQTTIIDETLFKKFFNEKENDIFKIVKSGNCNVRP